MSIDDDIAALHGVSILRPLGGPALRILAIGAENQRVESGQVLLTAGETADGAFIVQRGSFILKTRKTGEGDSIAGPAALLGETALFAETKWPFTATARESSVVMRLSRAMFLKMLEGYPDAAHRLREVIAARTDRWTREIENVRTALSRGVKPI
jgi:CRP-like cAMP-binding protein